MERCIIKSSISEHFLFARGPADAVYPHNTTVFLDESLALFAILQSRVHEVFGLFFSSGLEDRGGYRPSDAFLPFPLPVNYASIDRLATATARSVYEVFRGDLMVRNNEGLTKTYNHFHDPDERSPDILKLRELHAAMDRAVLDAYGWTDLQPTCEFLLDYEEDDDESGSGRRRKKPWRFRWPDDIRDEVLARLLELNRQARPTTDALHRAPPPKERPKNHARNPTDPTTRGKSNFSRSEPIARNFRAIAPRSKRPRPRKSASPVRPVKKNLAPRGRKVSPKTRPTQSSQTGTRIPGERLNLSDNRCDGYYRGEAHRRIAQHRRHQRSDESRRRAPLMEIQGAGWTLCISLRERESCWRPSRPRPRPTSILGAESFCRAARKCDVRSERTGRGSSRQSRWPALMGESKFPRTGTLTEKRGRS